MFIYLYIYKYIQKVMVTSPKNFIVAYFNLFFIFKLLLLKLLLKFLIKYNLFSLCNYPPFENNILWIRKINAHLLGGRGAPSFDFLHCDLWSSFSHAKPSDLANEYRCFNDQTNFLNCEPFINLQVHKHHKPSNSHNNFESPSWWRRCDGLKLNINSLRQFLYNNNLMGLSLYNTHHTMT